MRRKIVAGNWKLHGTRAFATALVAEITAQPVPGVELVIDKRAISTQPVEDEFEFPLSSQAPLEPHGAICRFGTDGDIEIWASNQAPFVLRDVLADMFGMPASKVRVHIPYLGGGFGGKSDVSIEPMVAYAASFVPG